MDKILDLEREELYRQIGVQIGKTPLHRVSNVPNGNSIYAKEEWRNPTGSVFDRLYPFLFRIAEEDGLIVPGISPVIEASTGNAGASFAWCSRSLGYSDCTVITHEDTPKARVEQMRNYGAKIVFSPAGEYAAGYVRKLEEILAEDRKSKGKLSEDPTRMYCVTKIHPRAPQSPGYVEFVDEVLSEIDLVDCFVCGVGSGTTISGIGRRLKERNPRTRIIAVEHMDAPVITRFRNGRIAPVPKNYQNFGLGASGLPPEKLDIDLSILDDVELVSDQDWKDGFEYLKTHERKDVGRSSCAVFEVALRLAERESNKKFLILFADPSWKYTDSYPHLK